MASFLSETVGSAIPAEPRVVSMRSVPTNVGCLAVYDTGVPSRPDASTQVLVLWPSVLADHHIYDAQVAALRERYRLILIDGPGHGASGAANGTFSMARCADAVVQSRSAPCCWSAKT